MAAGRLLISPILTWECITALQIRCAYLVHEQYGGHFTFLLFDKYTLLILNFCSVRSLYDVDAVGRVTIVELGTWKMWKLKIHWEWVVKFWSQIKLHPQARKKQDSKICKCLLYIILLYMVAQLFYPEMTLFWQKNIA